MLAGRLGCLLLAACCLLQSMRPPGTLGPSGWRRATVAPRGGRLSRGPGRATVRVSGQTFARSPRLQQAPIQQAPSPGRLAWGRLGSGALGCGGPASSRHQWQPFGTRCTRPGRLLALVGCTRPTERGPCPPGDSLWLTSPDERKVKASQKSSRQNGCAGTGRQFARFAWPKLESDSRRAAAGRRQWSSGGRWSSRDEKAASCDARQAQMNSRRLALGRSVSGRPIGRPIGWGATCRRGRPAAARCRWPATLSIIFGPPTLMSGAPELDCRSGAGRAPPPRSCGRASARAHSAEGDDKFGGPRGFKSCAGPPAPEVCAAAPSCKGETAADGN